jgi:hypothetical protein
MTENLGVEVIDANHTCPWRPPVRGIFGFAPCEALAALTTISCVGH